MASSHDSLSPGSSNPLTPGSPHPNPLSTSLCLNSEELQENARQACNRAVGSKPAASLTSLSSHSSKGGSVTKVRKRKASRGTGRAPHIVQGEAMPPIRRLSADKSHFKDIVHRFTGKPSAPPATSLHKLPLNLAADNDQRKALLSAAISQSLRTLHIISSCLLLQYGCSQDSIKMLSEINKSKSLAILQAVLHSQVQASEVATNNTAPSSSTNGDLGLLLARQLHNNPKEISNMNMQTGSQGLPAQHGGCMQHLQQSQQLVAQLESFLLKGSNEMDSLCSLH